METGTNRLERALERLRAELGPDRILEGSDVAAEIGRRSLNPRREAALRCLVRPSNTEECRLAVAALGALAREAMPIGALTTFWEPRWFDARIGVDTLALRSLCRIDARERIGYFGAGITVREADRLARAHGLCLAAYPDSDGEASVGSMAAVACTTGLGMARMQPVDQIVGLTVVTPEATVLKTGAAWRRGRGGVAQGLPDPAGIFLGSQGRFGIITEVVLALPPAPFLAARTWRRQWTPPDELAAQLRLARRGMDKGMVDSLRLETVCPGRERPSATEWFLRCWSPESADFADRRCAALAQGLGARDPVAWVESAAARQGELPDHDGRYSLPPGEHHARTGRDGFLGIEVVVNWGDQLDSALGLFVDLFEALGALGPGHRRLGIYPASHAVSLGIQVMLSGGEAEADAVLDAMAGFVEPLDALGVVPYKPGRLWRTCMEERETTDPACVLLHRAARFGDAS